MKPDIQIRLDLLKKYYAYDEASKVFTIALHYEKVTDILYKEMKSVSGVPMMSEEFLSDVTGILEDIPRGYRADIILKIDDYEGYDEKVIMESFNDMLEFSRLKYSGGSQKKYYQVATLLVVGLLLLFCGIFSGLENWWHIFDSEKLFGDLFENLLEISGWVFCWEAVSMLFLEDSDDMVKGHSIISKLARVSLTDKKDKVVAIEEYEQIQKHFYRKTPLQRTGSLLLIFSGFAFIGLGSMVGIRALPTISIAVRFLGGIFFALNLLWIAITIAGGIFAIKLYIGKEKYRIPAAIFGAINLAFIIFVIVFSIMNGIDVSLITINIASAVIEIAYCLGFFFTLEYKKKNK